MSMRLGISLAAGIAVVAAAGLAWAQVPPDFAATLKEIGPRIEVQRTGAFYAAALPPSAVYAGVYASRDIAFGSDPRQKLDVITAADTKPGGKRPVLVFVHGGGFTGGDKHGQNSVFYDNLMAWAARNGMVGVNVNYRLAPAAPWPAGAEDLASAVAWTRANIGRYGGDPDKVYLWGHSVGATHVADYLAHDQFHPKGGAGVKGAILTSGQVYDLVGPQVTAAYYGTDASRYPSMASLPGLLKTRVRLFLNSAEHDPAPFREQTMKLKDALCAAKRCPVYVDLKDHNHISETYAIGTDDRSLSDPVLKFVRGR